jgi:hypothetical protein
MVELPVQVTVRDDDLRRSRLTVFFRLLLAIPHLVWLYLWASVAYIVAFIGWVAALFTGRLPRWAHEFLGAYIRFTVHLAAYLSLAANPYPGFVGAAHSYPVDLDIAPPERQNRWAVLFRLVLALPAALLAGYGTGALLFVIPFFAWFACLAQARVPRGFRDALVYAIGYSAQATAYLLLLTPRYPTSDPAAAPAAELPTHPIRLSVDGDDLRRSRLTVFFRYLLYLPHYVWLTLWTVLVYLVAIIAWFAALITGRVPESLHRFMAAWLRYQTHVNAFLYLTANPFPGFTGRPGSYPVELTVGPRIDQSRWVTLGRVFLALPALAVATTLSFALSIAGVLGWFAALATGRMPDGLRNLQAYALRYYAQTYAYAVLVTARYPYSGPGPCDRPAVAPEPAPEPVTEAV